MKILKPAFFIIFASIIFSFTMAAFSQDSQVKLQDTEWLRTWLLCGPFPLQSVSETAPDITHLPGFETDFLKAHGGESNPRIKVGQIESFEGGSATWITHTTEDSIINLDQAVSTQTNIAAYGYCEIEAPEDKVGILALGTNDGGRLWLNGEQIWDHPEARGLVPDDDFIPVFLRQGINTLLFKIEERGNIWGFCARFLPLDVGSFLERTPLFHVITRKDDTATLRFLQSESVIKQIFKKAQLEIYSQDDPKRVIRKGNWTKKRESPLDIDTNKFGKYIIKISATLVDDKIWNQELPFNAGRRVEYALFENGKTDYVITIGMHASESEQWAAKELRHRLKEISSADFPVRFDADRSHKHEIVVGFNNRTQALLGKVEAPDDLDESFTYKNIGPKIVIYGGSERGTMYGVFTFLERELGCRWYTPRVSIFPRKEKFTFDYLNHSESPTIRVRNDFFYEAFEPIWAARNKINGAMGYREQHGGVECYWSVHTFYRFMLPSEFVDKHPEYYSLIDGKRIHERAQLCLTNPDVLRIVTEQLKQTMRDHPEYLIYSVSQNDWRNPCQCEKCQAIAKREGSESGPLIWFVNQIAEKIEKEFPDKFVGTLAYQYTRKPCKTIQPRHNVVIRLCSIECCFSHDFHSCPENESFISDLQGWADISPHLYIWDYVVNFSHYIMPYPNFRVLQPNIQTLRDNKAIGIMEQAAYQSRGGEFAELRAYVISKLLWNPECDVEKVIDDFMYGYYGRSGQYVRKYFDLLHNRLTPDTHIHLGLQPDDKLFSDEFVREAEAIFDQAEAVADNEEMRHRVEMARLPIMYLKCNRSPNEAKYYGTYDRFNEIVAREGITHYAERGVPHREAFHKRVEAALK